MDNDSTLTYILAIFYCHGSHYITVIRRMREHHYFQKPLLIMMILARFSRVLDVDDPGSPITPNRLMINEI